MSLFTRAARRGASLSRTYATVSDAAGVKVAGLEGGAPAGTVNLTVVVKAGSRYESKPGVAHALKNFAFKSASQGSALKIARETELYGGVLSSTLSREHLFLTAEFLRGDEEHFLSLLASVLSTTHYYPHEYNELVLPTIQTEYLSSLSNTSTLALDVAHQLAFRRGLGNSLYAAPHAPVTAADIKSFAQQAYAKSNVAVLGGGISTDALSRAVSSAFGSGSSGASSLSGGASTYYGGEQRIPIDSHTYPDAKPTLLIAYGTGSAPSADLKVLPQLLGGGSSVKWCAGTSPFSQIVEQNPGASIETKLLPYSDASLFTVAITAPTNEAVRAIAGEVVKTIKGAKYNDAEVKKAIAKAKLAEATKFETAEGLLSVAAQGLFSGSLATPDSSFASLDKVSASTLSKAAGDLFKAKPTVVALGDLAVLPYADEIGL